MVLYFFATGSVRGFAYFLALSTFLDLILAYCFMYPAVSILARNPKLVQMPGVGIAAGLYPALVLSGLVSTDVPEVTAAYLPLLGGARPEVYERDEWRGLVWRGR